MKPILFLLSLLLNLIYCLSGLNLTHYQVEIQFTNASNVSSFEECLCECLNSSDCSYFGYLSSLSIPICQLYTLSEGKPNIVNYLLSNNDTQTGLYYVPSQITTCKSSVSSLSYNSSNNTSSYASLSGNRIISVLAMSMENHSRLLAIDSNNASYYIFDIDTFQVRIY
jgi:hypothetical protein